MFGYESLKKRFKKLVESKNLSQAYLFFGEPKLGKFLFAQNFANYLENKKFADLEPSQILNELLIISPVKQSIGIDPARTIKDFLYKKPVFSQYRIVIIRDAEYLTPEAQNAMLKILEEPPVHGLIILISSSPENLFEPLLSRLQKIYFSRFSKKEISGFLLEKFDISREKSDSMAEKSSGLIGKAVELVSSKNTEIEKIVSQFLNKSLPSSERRELLYQLADLDEQNFDKFFEIVISQLKRNLIKNSYFLKKVLRCLTTIKQINVNKKLQLENLSLSLNI